MTCTFQNFFHLTQGFLTLISLCNSYGVCHGLRSMKQDDCFESILTTFKSSIIFRGSWGSSANLIEPKIEPPLNLACPNPWNAQYRTSNSIGKLHLVKFVFSVIFLGSSWNLTLLSEVPQKVTLDSKVVKIDSKIIISIRWPKSVTHSVECYRQCYIRFLEPDLDRSIENGITGHYRHWHTSYAI